MTWLTLSVRAEQRDPEDLVEEIGDLLGVVRVNWHERPRKCTCGAGDDAPLGPEHHANETCDRYDDGEVFK